VVVEKNYVMGAESGILFWWFKEEKMSVGRFKQKIGNSDVGGLKRF